MTQPSYVPVSEADQVRQVERLRVPGSWTPSRPAEIKGARQPSGRELGTPGPDQGYALVLARRFEDRLQLAEGESAEDAVAGCVALAMRRAALFGRAPVIHDCEAAFRLWGYLGGAPDDLVQLRKRLFAGAAHDYWAQRAISDAVPDETLRLGPAQLAACLQDWRSLIRPS
jgi:hypothetical protein